MILTQWLLLICLYLCVGTYVLGNPAVSNIMVSSQFYNNFKILSVANNPFLPLNFTKELSLTSARISCARLCIQDRTCQGLNFYYTSNVYVCERLPDNLCITGSRSVTYFPGNYVWDKITNGKGQSCIDKFTFSNGTAIDCDKWMPGCQGTWPNCRYNCIQTCSECYSRYQYVVNASTRREMKDCYLWTLTATTASFMNHKCYGNATVLMYQTVDSDASGSQFFMPFDRMNGLCKLYPGAKLKFRFLDSNNTEYAVVYNNAYIEANGTLWNMTFSHFEGPSLVDLFNLQNGTLQPTPFVTITDNTNVCGSFWLRDVPSRNSCPGGNVSMFGYVTLSGANITSTGIRAPGTPAGVMFYYASVSLIV